MDIKEKDLQNCISSLFDSKGRDSGCFGQQRLLGKEKGEPFGSAQDKQAPALHAQ